VSWPPRDPARWGRPARRRPIRLNRRDFLRGTGGVAVALPFLTSLRSKRAHAQGEFPTRFCVFVHPNGVIPSTWFPTAGSSPTDFSLNTSMAPLEPFKDKLVVTQGINMPSLATGPGEPHQKGMGGLLTGWPLLEPGPDSGAFVGGDGSVAGWGSGISLDQRLAQSIGLTTKIASLQLGVRATTAEVRSRFSYLGPAMPLPPINDPTVTFDQVFGDFSTEENTLALLQAQRRSVLDTVAGQFNLVKGRVSPQERLKLEAHQDMVRSIERRLTGEVLDGDHCLMPLAPPAVDWDNEENMPLVTQLQLDMLAMAFVCDVTRVATFQFSNAQNHIRFPWIDIKPEDPEIFTPSLGDGHSLSHAGPSNEAAAFERTLRATWFMQQMAYFLDRLDSIPEGDGTVLDNTLVLWMNELAVGNTHSHNNMPFLMAGGASGAIHTGRYLQFANGASHNQLLLAILQAFGVDEMSFGDPEHCPGPLDGLLA
jgi:hypothetical protein